MDVFYVHVLCRTTQRLISSRISSVLSFSVMILLHETFLQDFLVILKRTHFEETISSLLIVVSGYECIVFVMTTQSLNTQ